MLILLRWKVTSSTDSGSTSLSTVLISFTRWESCPWSEKSFFSQSPPLQVIVSCWAGRAQHRAAIPALYSHLKQFSAQLQQFVWVQQQTVFSAIVLVKNNQSLAQAATSYHSHSLSFEATQVAIPSDVWTLFEFWFLVWCPEKQSQALVKMCQ